MTHYIEQYFTVDIINLNLANKNEGPNIKQKALILF